jgi:hypothetical protein
MTYSTDADYYRRREAQELKASQLARDPGIRGLHWSMARHYAELAQQVTAKAEVLAGQAADSRLEGRGNRKWSI